MTFWIGVIIGVIVGANLGALMLALCTTANQGRGADAYGYRGDAAQPRPASRVTTQWARAFGSLARTPPRTG